MIIYTLFVVVFYVLFLFMLYRLPGSRKVSYFEGEVVFNFIETKMSQRDAFESIVLRKKFVTLVSEQRHFYIRACDKSMIWRDSPHELLKTGETLKLKLAARPLFFGGFGLSEVVDIVKIKKYPIITK